MMMRHDYKFQKLLQDRGSALLLVVATIGLLSLAVATAVRAATVDQNFLRFDLFRERALATAEAGIEYGILHKNECKAPCSESVPGQGAFTVQVVPAEDAAEYNWFLNVSLLNKLVTVRLLGIKNYEWVAVSEGTVGDIRRVVAVRFDKHHNIVAWQEVTPP